MAAEVLTKQVKDWQWASVSGRFSESTVIYREKARLPPRPGAFLGGWAWDCGKILIFPSFIFSLLTSQVICVKTINSIEMDLV